MHTKSRGAVAKEQGFAALFIAIILVTVLSLITVGFAQLMRREQRAALDRQLSSAAYYAAESGINDANRALQGGYTKAKTNCGNKPTTDVDYSINGSEYLKNTSVDRGAGTKYTCLLINPNPSDLQYSSIPVNQATSAIITGADATGATSTISKLVFSWQDDNGGQIFAPSGWFAGNNAQLPPVGGWTNGGAITGMLRISITPLANLTRDALINNTYTAFLYPRSTGSQTAMASLTAQPMDNNTGAKSGSLLDGKCYAGSGGAPGNTPRYCAVAIDLGSFSGSDFVVHMSSIYRSTAVTITPFSSSGAKMYIKGAQTVVDVTGKARDVLKRVQVRIPARNSYDYPEFDVQTVNGICKQLSVYPPNQATNTPGSASSSCNSL